MSQAAELLASLEEHYPTHDHNVSDPDSYFVIDPDTRQIYNLSQSPNVLMQNDHNSEVYTFEIPRFVEGHDMLNCDRVRLHYINVGKSSSNKYKDVYEMSDLRINPKDASTLISTWTIKRQATQYPGSLSFVIQYLCIDESITDGETSNISYEWHTDIYKDIEIRETINNSEEAIADHSDILEEWYQRLFGMEDSLTAAVIAVADAQKTAIEAKGAAVLATIPEEYATTHNMADEALRKKANAIEQTAEGETTVISDSADAYLLGLNLYGKTTQSSTTGTQLFDSGAIINNLYTIIGSDGKIAIDCDNRDGTASKYATFYSPVNDILEPSTTYAMVLEVFSTSNVGENVYLASHYNDELSQFEDTPSVTTPTVGTHVKLAKTYDSFASSKYMCRGFMTIPAGTHVKSVIRFSIVADTSITAENFVYESYSGGVPSPTPEWAQPLNSIESPSISVYGKNLAYQRYSVDYEVSGIRVRATPGKSEVYLKGTATKQFSHTVMCTDYFQPGTYTMSTVGVNRITSVTDRLYIMDYDTNKVLVNYIKDDSPKTVELIKPMRFRIDMVFGEGSVYDRDVKLQIELGGNATDYEPCRKTQVLNIDRSIHGIPVDSGGNYTDANGQQWICDEIDFERGVYVQRTQLIELTGREGWTLNTTAVSRGFNAYHTIPSAPQIPGKGYCSHFVNGRSWESATIEDMNKFWVANANAIVFKTDGVQTMDEFKTMLASEYTAGTPVTVCRVLQTPIETQLTDEEIANFKMVCTNYPNTVVLNDSGAHMAVKYNADTKAYVDGSIKASVTDVLEAIKNGSY